MSGRPPAQVWEADVDGRHHRVEMTDGFVPRLVWTVDGDEVATGKAGDRTTTLSSSEHGRLVVRTSLFSKPRRASVLGKGELIGGVDLQPAPGSPAARHHDKVLAHPGRYTALETLGAAGGVVVPIIIFALLARLAFEIPWPDLPSIPWPNLPDINLPSIPWPDVNLPSVKLPEWVRLILENAKYVVPVIIAFVLARAEIRRRRQADLGPTVDEKPEVEGKQ